MAEARAVKFCIRVLRKKYKKITPKVVWLWSLDLFKFLAPLQDFRNG